MRTPGPAPSPATAVLLLQRGLLLEFATLGWNVAAVGLLLWVALRSRSVAIFGFALDSLLEIGASLVVIWQLRRSSEHRRRRALQLLSVLFAALAVYIGGLSAFALLRGTHAAASRAGIVWLSCTVLVMLLLAGGKHRTGLQLGNDVLQTEARVTLIDASLAAAVLAGVLLNHLWGWWWADPAAALLIVFYGARESRHAWREAHD
jgi:divalent metal cation (Fe/Co/Zn/Cd) transporter